MRCNRVALRKIAGSTILATSKITHDMIIVSPFIEDKSNTTNYNDDNGNNAQFFISIVRGKAIIRWGNEDMKISVNSIDVRGSIADGPGIRVVVYLQGCERRCQGCHNPSTWDPNAGETMEVDVLARFLKENAENSRITISGGEPLLQSEALLELLSYLNGFDVTLYTSYELEEVPESLLNHLSYIKVGRFIEELNCSTMAYVGSTNQRFISLREST
jgi:anaerobic ribonucleoside-triphosphate reductase activating protein